MTQNLLSFLHGQLSADAIAQVSTFLGETTTDTSAAITAALQALFATMAHKASTPGGANDLVSMVTRVTGDGSLSQLAGLVATGSHLGDVARLGGPVATALLGNSQPDVIDWLASTTGIGRGSASSLLAMLTPLALSGLSRYLTSTGAGVNTSTIANTLSAQAPASSHLPAALAAALGVPMRRSPSHSGATPARAADGAKDGGLGFLRYLMPVLAIAALLAYVLTRQPAIETAADVAERRAASASGLRQAAPSARSAAPTTAPAPAASLGAMVARSLPGGVSIQVPENGIESRLLAFITDSSRQVDATTWFSFDRLEFDTGSATLRPSSNAQLDAIASILKAYPNVAIKIGGYTDNVGDDASNRQLSAWRAARTKDALVARGVEASRLESEGYGEQFPVASNDTEEGRQRNRRIDVRVTRK